MDPQTLVEAAQVARARAYAPYSHYTVGAAVLTANGTVIVGCNVENASYGATICAERVALTGAVAAGHREFVALALVTANGMTPCGLCRQVMAELAPQMIVYIARPDGQYQTTTVAELLPHAFGPAALETPPAAD